MAAPKIMIVRHAEKPPVDKPPYGPPYGVNSQGVQDPESLILDGWQRAGALASFFAFPKVREISVPMHLFASGLGQHSSSMRPQETLTPLAKVLGKDIHTKYLKGQEPALASDAMNSSGPVLIAWEHQDIPAIANAIAPNAAPRKWPSNRFDLVWIFDQVPGGGYLFHQVPQLLLAGDSVAPISEA